MGLLVPASAGMTHNPVTPAQAGVQTASSGDFRKVRNRR